MKFRETSIRWLQHHKRGGEQDDNDDDDAYYKKVNPEHREL